MKPKRLKQTMWRDERWKPILGYPYYEASTKGRIRTWKMQGSRGLELSNEPRLLKPFPTRKGYLSVKLSNDGISPTISVAKLIIETFWGKHHDPEITVDHKNNVRADNRIENLQYLTRRENTLKGNGPPAINARKVLCPKGHLLEHPNLIRYLLPYRHCRQCKSLRDRRYRENRNRVRGI